MPGGFFFNGQAVAVLDPISYDGIPSPDRGALEIMGESFADLRLTDRSETFPAGRFRWQTVDNEIRGARSRLCRACLALLGASWA